VYPEFTDREIVQNSIETIGVITVGVSRHHHIDGFCAVSSSNEVNQFLPIVGEPTVDHGDRLARWRLLKVAVPQGYRVTAPSVFTDCQKINVVSHIPSLQSCCVHKWALAMTLALTRGPRLALSRASLALRSTKRASYLKIP